MKGWRRKILVGCGAVLGLAFIGVAGVWIWKPWVPPVEVSDPGPGGRRIVDNGLFANYFPGKGAGRRPAILLLGGSEGGLGRGTTRQARGLAEQGYAVLQLSYFRTTDPSEKLELVPLELFGRGLDWLRAQPGVAGDRIAVMGGSRGAEAALLIASRHPELKAVVAGMPSSVIWAGFSWATFGSKNSSWSEGGKPVPFLPYGPFDYKEGIMSGFRLGLATLTAHPDAAIPIERTTAPILLICGERDTLWPSCSMARQVEARARQFGHPAVTVLAYADAGHAVLGTPREPGDPKFGDLANLGGSAAGNNAARIDNTPKIAAFLKAALAP